MTKRKDITPAPEPLEAYVSEFDDVFSKSNQREAFRRYLEGLLLPTERHKTLTGLVNTEPVVGAQLPRAQKLQWFLSESTWDERQVQAQRLRLLRENPATAPDAQGVLVIDETGDRKDGHNTAHVGRQYLGNVGKIDNGVVSVTSLWADETGDRKDGHKTAHVARQYLGNVGKIDNGVVSVTSLWADEQVYYPLDFEPYTPESYFAQGKNDPAFRTKPHLALQLIQQARGLAWPWRAVVADSLYGEDRGLRTGLRQLQVPYVMALKPSHTWWHPEGTAGSLQEVARAAGWVSPEQPGKWMHLTRTFHDGSTQDWWALEIVAGPYGPDKPERAIVASTDPATLPDLSTWYLVTNLPAPSASEENTPPFPPAGLEEVIRLYGLRMWVEQSYKQVKHALGWSEYQVRSDQAIRRHWQLVCCAFSFCWYHASPPSPSTPGEPHQRPEPPVLSGPDVSARAAGTGEKNQHGNTQATTSVLAEGTSSGARVVGAVDHAAALLASVVRAAPTRSAPMLA